MCNIGVECVYDSVLVPLGQEIKYQIWRTENAFRNVRGSWR